VLIDIAESSAVDIVIDEETIPVRQEVRFGCEMLGLDPLRLANEGKMVIVVAPEQSSDVIVHLRQHPLGKESTVIGTVQHTSSSSGQLILEKEHIKRVIVRSEGQALPRLC